MSYVIVNVYFICDRTTYLKSAVLCFAYLALRKIVLLFVRLPLSIDCISHYIQGVTFRFPNDNVHSYTLLKCLYIFGTLRIRAQAV